MKALFAVARWKQPCACTGHKLYHLTRYLAVIFVDEIDSLLTSRTESDVESSRRIKTEFLVQMEGIAQDASERLLFIGATNRYAAASPSIADCLSDPRNSTMRHSVAFRSVSTFPSLMIAGDVSYCVSCSPSARIASRRVMWR